MKRVVVAVALLAALAPAALAQPDPDAGVPAGPVDGGAAPDAGRIIIDGPTLLGIGKPQVAASASPTEMRLGDKFTLFVEVVFDESVTVSIPSGLDLAPSFDELKRSAVDERRSDGTRKRVYQIQLQAWELGDVRLPPIQVAYSVGGDTSWVVTNEVPLRIVGMIDAIDDPNALLGATPPVPVHRRDWRVVAAIIAVAALVIGLATWWLVRRYLRRRKPRVKVPIAVVAEVALDPPAATPAETTAGPPPTMRPAAAPPRRPANWIDPARLGDAARRALAALEALERSGELARDQLAGYRTMVGVVRTFLLERFELPSRHRTSRELVAALRKTAIVGDGLAGAEAWLASADLVKFAAAVDPADGVTTLSEARALIVTIDTGGAA